MASIYYCSLKTVVLLIILRAHKVATTNFPIAPLGGAAENHRIKQWYGYSICPSSWGKFTHRSDAWASGDGAALLQGPSALKYVSNSVNVSPEKSQALEKGCMTQDTATSNSTRTFVQIIEKSHSRPTSLDKSSVWSLMSTCNHAGPDKENPAQVVVSPNHLAWAAFYRMQLAHTLLSFHMRQKLSVKSKR